MKILVSARRTATRSLADWLQDLDWNDLATTLDVPPLTFDGLLEVAAQEMHCPTRDVDRAYASQLWMLTAGDPLLISMYLQDHSYATLSGTAPGIHGYFARMWRIQIADWSRQQLDTEKELTASVKLLNLLSRTLGPVTRNDLSTMLRELLPTGLHLESRLRKLDRWIVPEPINTAAGQQIAYTLTHPRLSEFFSGEMSLVEQDQMDQRIIKHCEDEFQRAMGGADPSTLSPYAVRWFGEHLVRLHSDDESLHRLIHPAWKNAWDAQGEGGFADDLHRAWQRADAALERASQPDETSALAVQRQTYYALVNSTMYSSATNIPTLLFPILLRSGSTQWGNRWVLAQLGLIGSNRKRGEVLAAIAPLLDESALRSCLAITLDIGDELVRVKTLTALLPHLSPRLMREALKVSIAFSQGKLRTTAIVALAPHLSGAVLTEALAEACAISQPFHRAHALGALIPFLPDGELQPAVDEALQAIRDARAISDRFWCIGDKKQHAFSCHFGPVFDSEDDTDEFPLPPLRDVVRRIAPYSSDDASRRILDMTMLTLKVSPWETDATDVNVIGSPVSADVANWALRAVAGTGDERVLEVIEWIARIADEFDAWSENVLQVANRLAPSERFRALVAVAHRAPQPMQLDLWRKAVPLLTELSPDVVSSGRLSSFIEDLPFELVSQVWELAEARSGSEFSIAVVPALASRSSRFTLSRALELLGDSGSNLGASESAKIALITRLASRLSPNDQVAALDILSTSGSVYSRDSALAVLVPFLDHNLLKETLCITQAIMSESSVSRDAFAAIAARLKDDLFDQALEVAKSAQNDSDKAGLLHALVPFLPLETISEALAIARSIGDELERYATLIEIESRLPADQQREDSIWQSIDSLLYALEREPVFVLGNQPPIFPGFAKFASVADRIPASQLERVLQSVKTLRNTALAEQIIETLAGRIPADKLEEMVEVMETVELDIDWEAGFRALSPYLSNDIVERTVLRHVKRDPLRRGLAICIVFLERLHPRTIRWICSELLSQCSGISDAEQRISAINTLGSSLSPSEASTALTAARTISAPRARTIALIHLVSLLPLDRRKAVVEEVSHSIPCLDGSDLRSLVGVMPELPRSLVEILLDADRKHNGPLGYPPLVLAGACRLPVLKRRHAFNEAAESCFANLLEDGSVETLVCLMKMTGRRRRFLLGERALAEINLYEGNSATVGYSIQCLAGVLIPDHLPVALKVVGRSIDWGRDRGFSVGGIRSIAARLAAPTRSKALDCAREIPDPSACAVALTAVAATFPQNEREAPLQEALGLLQNERLDLHAFAAMIELVPEDFLPQIVATVKCHFQDSPEIFKALSPRLSDALAEELLESVGESDVTILAQLAAHLKPEAARMVLRCVMELPEEFRDEPLLALASELPGGLVQEAMEAVGGISHGHYKARAVAGLIRSQGSRLNHAQWETLLGVAQSIHHEREVRYDIMVKDPRDRALAVILSQVPPDLISPILNAEAFTHGSEPRDDRLRILAWRLRRLPASQQRAMWAEALHSLARQRRSRFVEALVPIATVAEQFGGKPALESIVAGILDVGQWASLD
jgi:hypothetical protein